MCQKRNLTDYVVVNERKSKQKIREWLDLVKYRLGERGPSQAPTPATPTAGLKGHLDDQADCQLFAAVLYPNGHGANVLFCRVS